MSDEVIEFALMVEWSDGRPEFIPVASPEHAERLAKTLYAHRPTWTVGREVQPWRYVRRDPATLTDGPVLVWDQPL